MLRSYEVEITTAADGSATDYAGLKITGKVVAIKYAYGTLAATADFVITGATSGSPILTLTDVAQANTWWFPRILATQHNDGSAFTDASGGPPLVFAERIKIVTAQGGNAATGAMTFYVEDDTFVEAV
uniref:Uncharacterized protein n=1 Tax=viral metagenome TaxID=1070528 RepID=A0A6M3IKL7_9ZZZZ